jgi:hypothetical protein
MMEGKRAEQSKAYAKEFPNNIFLVYIYLRFAASLPYAGAGTMGSVSQIVLWAAISQFAEKGGTPSF